MPDAHTVTYYAVTLFLTLIYAELTGFIFYKLCIKWVAPDLLADSAETKVHRLKVSASKTIVLSISAVSVYAVVHGMCSRAFGMSGTSHFFISETISVVLVICTLVFISNRMPEKRYSFKGKSIADYHRILVKKAQKEDALILADMNKIPVPQDTHSESLTQTI